VVVVANASDTFGLATTSAERVRGFGYVNVIRSDGFENEANRLAQQLEIPPQIVQPRPEGQLVEGNADAELLVILGNNWREVTNLDSPQ